MFPSALTLTALLSVVLAQNNPPAPLVTNNLPGSGFIVGLNGGTGNITGSFSFDVGNAVYSAGVQVAASLTGFNLTDDNTYTYHIHEKPVPADGNCTGTGEHFDPYHASSNYTCDPNTQSLCQVGDLSGKHDAIYIDGVGTGSYSFTYFDEYLSTRPGNTSFFGNLSVVVHRKKDGLRLNCGNFTQLGMTLSTSDSSTSVASYNVSTTYMSPSVTVMTSIVATVTSSGSTSSQVATITTVQTFGATVTAAVPSSQTASQTSSQTSSQTTSVPVFTGSSALKSGFTMGIVMFALLVGVIGLLV